MRGGKEGRGEKVKRGGAREWREERRGETKESKETKEAFILVHARVVRSDADE